ncbi:hypothetical protein RRG08_014180 [Elysia crispata]|uniref:Uncharacterized protein n=1 Tax=Elysia crispata TaxID=231223 RepID=A0AAE1A719_9GAST|nr:hypothetical protein RRG08_014180 [Elysia crispata]
MEDFPPSFLILTVVEYDLKALDVFPSPFIFVTNHDLNAVSTCVCINGELDLVPNHGVSSQTIIRDILPQTVVFQQYRCQPLRHARNGRLVEAPRSKF